MPSDIRSFFGGGGAVKTAPSTTRAKDPPKKTAGKGRARKVVSDDDDDVEEVVPQKSTPAKKKPVKEEVKEEETTSSAYFATKPKSGKPTANGNSTPKKAVSTSAPSTGRRSARKPTKKYAESSDDEVKPKLDDEDGGDDDIHAEDFKNGRKADDYEESDSDDVPSKPKNAVKGKKAKVEDSDSDLEMIDISEVNGAGDTKQKPATARKRKADSDEGDETPKKKKKAAAPRKPAQKKDDEPDNSTAAQIMNSISTVRPPTPPARGEDNKFKFDPRGGNANAAPLTGASKEIPEGEENCLAGQSFVFTGVLETLGREAGHALVKKYGGKVSSAPSGKTSWVVLGEEAGPKKLETIAKLGIKTINEDGLFDLIRKMPAHGGDGKAAVKNAEQKLENEKKLQKEAEAMQKQEDEKRKQAETDAKAQAAARGLDAPVKAVPRQDDRLWVDKYAPDSMTGVCGNKKLVEDLQAWLKMWEKRKGIGFKQAGADGRGHYRAAMLHGPPGVGKTTAAHLVAKLEGYDVVETNASDTRSKKLVEGGLRGVLDTTSLLGYFGGDGKKVDPKKRKLLLIMDEVDGMSAGDRGGVGALASAAKKTQIPMILICNDRKLPKMKPFDFAVADFAFRRPTTDMIRSRIMTICYREGLKLPTNVIDAIIEGSHADIRQIINMISTIKLDNKQLDYNDSKAMSKAWEKHVILKPWDVCNKILRAEMFSPASTATLNDKIELYFNDHEFSYLMLQENYLKTKMAAASNLAGDKLNLKLLEQADMAAESISDGDLVDRMIHGSQQQWSLMPTHAVFSFVRPASYVNGNFGAQVGFTSWLGNNSKQSKLARYVKEIQGHMRLRTSADAREIRQQYMSALWNRTIGTMSTKGVDAVDEIIDFMDYYYLTKDDYDAIMELGLGPMNQEGVKIETATKAAFTRKYNQRDHPISHLGARAGAAPTARLGGKKEKPDLEEAVDESEDEAVEAAELADDDDEEIDLKKDRYIKAPKKKPAKKGEGKSKAKAKKRTKDEASDASEDDKPQKKRAPAGAGKGRGRGKGK